MDERKETLQQEIARAKIKIILSSIAEAIILILELYIMINMKDNFIAMAFGILFMICGLFFLISGILDVSIKNKEIDTAKYEDIYNAQKASYLVIKKSFDEMDERLKVIEENSQLPAEEIISAQKAVAKVTISRSKENTDALMNSNDELINQLFSLQEKLDNSNASILEKQQEILNATRDELQRKITELTSQIVNMEGRVPVQAAPAAETYVSAPEFEEPVNIDQFDEMPGMEAEASIDEQPIEIEEDSLDLDISMDESEEVTEEVSEELDLDLDISLDEIASEESTEELDMDLSMDEEIVESEESEDIGLDMDLSIDEPVEELNEEETPIEGNTPLEEVVSPEDIPEELPVEEVIEEQVEEPVEPIESIEEEQEIEPEPEEPPVASEPVAIPDVGIDLSDPNRVMSPEEIEKLFASI